MTCIDEDVLLRLELGELDASNIADIESHLAGCASCREQREFQRRMIEDLAPPAASDADEVFVQRVMAARAEQTEPRSTKPLATLIAFGAAAAIVCVMMLNQPSAPQSRQAPELTPRGAEVIEEPEARVEAFVGKPSGNSAPALLEGALLRAGEGIAVRYSNPTDRDAFLMVFAIDSKSDVHWLHPAYLREGENPQSIRLPRRTEQRVLDEIAEPVEPAPGSLRVYAVLTDKALRVRDVESAITKNQGSVSGLYPDATVEEWKCTWQAQ